MMRLKFEWVGDITTTYPYLCVYFQNEKEPFMDIGVKDNKELEFSLYGNTKDVFLTREEWIYILKKGEEFLPKVIENEQHWRALE